MTPNREDYIKAIFHKNDRKEKLNNKELSEMLNVSAASTSEMVRKLIESGHVERDKQSGLVLTNNGRREAEALVRKHRLWEVFLVEYLNYSWTEVHDEAEVLEHVTSDLLADRLNNFLEFPKFCPHGEIIFGNHEHLEDETFPMLSLKKGQKARFVRVKDSGELLHYLETIGLSLQDEFTLKQIQPYGGALELVLEEKEIWVSQAAAKDLYVIKI